MHTLTHYFSESYFAAREKFRRSVEQRGANWQAVVIAARGPNDEELTLDVAHLGVDQPERTVVVSSGLHGVEGFFGSAVQTAWLSERGAASLPAGTRLLFLHAVNPFGFAWRRRWDDQNVDLNRNFLVPGERYAGTPAKYVQIEGLLNPCMPPSRPDTFALRAACSLLRHGRAALAQAVPAGQYDYPQGLFYGGSGPSEIYRLIEQHFAGWLGPAREVLHVDLHSGLGKFGTCQMLVDAPPSDPRVASLCRKFGPELVSANRLAEGFGKSGVIYSSRGTWEKWCLATFPDRDYNFATAEFGTYSGVRVVGALRAENRAFHYARPLDPQYEWTRLNVVEAFAPQSPAWRESVVRQGLALIDRALSCEH